MKKIFAGFQNTTRAVCAILLIGLLIPACGGAVEVVTVQPKTHERHLRNPGMGLILYLWGDNPSHQLPELADVLFVTLVWPEIENNLGEYNFSIPKIKNALSLAEKNDRMAAIRLLTSFQNTPCPIPHDLVDKGVKLFPKAVAANDDLLSEWDVDFYEPEWWHPEYIKAYRNMVEAYGKALDGNPRLAWIDMRFYGYWGEGHRFHATVPWPDDIDKREWCKSRLDEFRAAFKKTPLVMETACDENTPYPEGTAIDYAVDHGLWMRRDGFGNYVSPEESAYLKANWKRSLIVAENAQSLDNFLNGKVRKWWDENAKPTTIDQLFDEIFDHHVNYFPLGWSQQAYELVERERPDLWKKASLKTGYRMIVAEASWPKTASASGAVDFTTTWRNTAVGRLPFPYVPTLYLLDADGKAVAKAAQPAADATKWYENEGHAVEFKLTLAEGIAPGEYKVAVGIEDENAKPAIRLGIDGDDGQRRHVLGTISLE